MRTLNLAPRRAAVATDYLRTATALLAEVIGPDEDLTQVERFEIVAVDAAHALGSVYTAELAGAAMVINATATDANTPVALRRWLETRDAEELLELVAEAVALAFAGYTRTGGWLRKLDLEIVGNDVIRRTR